MFPTNVILVSVNPCCSPNVTHLIPLAFRLRALPLRPSDSLRRPPPAAFT